MVEFEFEFDWGRAAWIALGVVLAAAVVWVLYSFVGTFVFALFIYYSTRRVHSHIRDRVGQPSVSAGIALVAIALPGVLLLIYTGTVALGEAQEFAGQTDLGGYLDVAGPYLNVSRAVEDPAGILRDAGGMDLVGSVLERGSAYLGVLATGLLHLFVMFAVAFYLLRDDHKLAGWVRRFDTGAGVVDEFADEVDDSLEKIFAGNILNAVVTATVGAITYSVLNVVAPPEVAIPSAALVGLLTGIASLIPVVGMKLVYVPVTGYLAFLAYANGSGWGFVAVFALVSFVVVDVIPDLIVRPYVTGGSLHTGSVMFAYILGPLLFGWYGLFLGPMILVFATHFARVVVPELVSERSERPAGVDPSYLSAPTGETTSLAVADDGSAAPENRSDAADERSDDADSEDGDG